MIKTVISSLGKFIILLFAITAMIGLGSCSQSVNNDTAISLFVAPNPSTSITRVYVRSAADIVADYQIVDAYGREVHSAKAVPCTNGSTAIDVSTVSFTTGAYYFILKTGPEFYKTQFTVVH